MHDTELVDCVRAWQQNKPPTYPHEFDALFTQFTFDSLDVYALVKYNGARGWYECRLCNVTADGTVINLQLELSVRLFRQLKRQLRSLGIKHLLDVTERGKPKRSKISTLPKTLFPTLINR